MAVQANQKFCTTCGKPIHEKAEICPHCGVRQPGMAAAGGRNKVIAGLLALFFGWLGIHKFYLGQNGLGVAYLLFFWTGIPLIIGVIDAVILFSMSDDAFNTKYNP